MDHNSIWQVRAYAEPDSHLGSKQTRRRQSPASTISVKPAPPPPVPRSQQRRRLTTIAWWRAHLPRVGERTGRSPLRGRQWSRRWLGGMSVATLATLTGVPALALPMSFSLTGSGNLLVAHHQDYAGICAGDSQLISGLTAQVADFTVVTHRVGEDIPRNLTTSTGHHETKQVMDAKASYLISALYHLYRPKPTDSTLQAESFAWAVQNQMPSWGWFSTRPPADGAAQAKKMIAHAQQWAGPYRMNPKLAQGESTSQLRLSEVGVQGQVGKWLPGLAGTVTLSGPATFPGGKTTHVFTTAKEPITLKVEATGPGTVTAKVSISGLPADQIDLLESPHYQDLISVKPRTSSVSARAQITISPPSLEVDFHTQVASGQLEADEAAIDNIFLTAPAWPTGFDGEPVTLRLRARLYGPFAQLPAQSSEIPEDAQLVGEQLLEVNGSGTYQARLSPASVAGVAGKWQPGHYTWVLSARNADQNSPGGNGATVQVRLQPERVSDFAIAEESFEVVAPGSPTPPPSETPTPMAPPPSPTPTPTPTPPTPPAPPATPEIPEEEPSRLPETGAKGLFAPTSAIALAGCALVLLSRAYRTPETREPQA